MSVYNKNEKSKLSQIETNTVWKNETAILYVFGHVEFIEKIYFKQYNFII